MDIHKKKKKQIKLSPFTQITPIMPDSDKSIDKFNEVSDVNMSNDMSGGVALGEAVKNLNLDNLKMEIITTTIDYMIDNGFDEDEASAYTDFEIVDEGDRIKIEVRLDSFGMDMEGELCTVLDPIVAKYDTDAYFDLDYPGILQAFIYKDVSIEESLYRICRFDENYQTLKMYQLHESALSSDDKDKLKKFVDKSEDADEIEIFMKGLMSKSKSLKEYLSPNSDMEDEFNSFADECNHNIYDELPEDVQIYLDELDGPWIAYGRLPSGICFYSDSYDITFFSDIEDFISDQRYNIEQYAETFVDNEDGYDFGEDMVNLLLSRG